MKVLNSTAERFQNQKQSLPRDPRRALSQQLVSYLLPGVLLSIVQRHATFMLLASAGPS